MSRQKYIDVTVLLIIGIFISIGFCNHFSEGFVLPVNFYLGCMFWLGTIFYKYISRNEKFFIFYLLMLSTFNVLIFSASIMNFGSSVHYLYKEEKVIIASFGINPMALLSFVVYCLVSRNIVSELFNRLFHGTEKETITEMDKELSFIMISLINIHLKN